MKKILVLGAGLVGKTVARHLSRKFDVTCSDRQLCSLEQLTPRYQVAVEPCDFRNKKALTKLLQPFDLVVGAVPGSIGFDVLQTVIEAGKNVVDISFFPEDPFLLDKLAKENNVTAAVDCGVAPGLCNLIAGHHHAQARLSYYECLVGGLPVQFGAVPFDYKAVFSPADVIEEYTRPVHCIEHGAHVVKEALSGTGPIVIEGLPELEAFYTDGLRTLLTTLPGLEEMKEKTLRYPGHAAAMKAFRDTGLFGKEPVDLQGNTVSPLQLTSKLLFSKWQMQPGEEDITAMRVTVENNKGRYIYTLVDHFDRDLQITSMARTTGYTCAAVASLMAEGLLARKGICPPELIGEDEQHFRYITNYLASEGIRTQLKTINISSKTVA